MACSAKGSFKDRFGYVDYQDCDYKVYCVATFKLGTTGEFVTKEFCKKHFNALVKNIDRVKRITKWDSELSYTIK